MENLTIDPLKGYGNMPFGMTLDDVVKLHGEPDYQEEIESITGDGNLCTNFEYDNLDLSIYFEGVASPVISCFSIHNPDSLLYGERVFDLNKKQIIELMKRRDYSDYEEEVADGEDCLSYEELMLDFYFEEDKVTEVLIGVVIDEQENTI